MARAPLQKMLDALPFATLPPAWTTFDLVAETLSCITGQRIRRITVECVEFEDDAVVALKEPP